MKIVTPSLRPLVLTLLHSTTLLFDGQVLIAGGASNDGGSTNSSELYDPATGLHRLASSMIFARMAHTATVFAKWPGAGHRRPNSFVSLPVANFAPGYALATVFVNGIPSVSRILLISPGLTKVALLNPTRLAGGEFQFSFTGMPGTSFTAMATTNVSLGPSSWSVLGAVTEVSPGQFQFTDTETTNNISNAFMA